MKRFDILLLFSIFVLSSTVLFQNCSEIKSAANNSDNLATDSDEDTRAIPEFLTNREFSLDNKVVANSNLETTWSVGGTDIFYYETDYRATYESTLVTITGDNSVAMLKVTADECNEEKALTYDESVTLSRLFSDYIPSTEIRTRMTDEAAVTAGCAFPRLSLDATSQLSDGSDAVDFDIFFSTPECTPDNEFYITDRNDSDPAAALADVEAFFHAQIDDLCP